MKDLYGKKNSSHYQVVSPESRNGHDGTKNTFGRAPALPTVDLLNLDPEARVYRTLGRWGNECHPEN